MSARIKFPVGYRIAVFCGGSGAGPLVNQLLDSGADVCCLVNAYDDGKSTGRLRKLFGVLGPSDMRKNLLSLMDLNWPRYWSLHEAFTFRFPADESLDGEFRAAVDETCAISDGHIARGHLGRLFYRLPEIERGTLVRNLKIFQAELVKREGETKTTFSFGDCAIGNCILIGGLIHHGGSWDANILELEQTLHTRGQIRLVSEELRHLSALCTDGTVLASEEEIITDAEGRILDIFLSAQPPDRTKVSNWVREEGITEACTRIRNEIHAPPVPSDAALRTLREADMIIYAPGTFFSSLLPSLIVRDVPAAIRESEGTKVLVCNIAEDSDTRGFSCTDFVLDIERRVGGRAVDVAIANEPPSHGEVGYHRLGGGSDRDTDRKWIVAALEDRTAPGRHLMSRLRTHLLGILYPGETPTIDRDDRPLVSVVIPTWNRRDELRYTLETLHQSGYPNAEIIVVDNGSKDGTHEMVSEEFPAVMLVRLPENDGMNAYNVGFATSRGEYVLMLDDDAHLAPNAIETMVDIWQRECAAEVGVMAFRVHNPIANALETHLWEERICEAAPGREREITSFGACATSVRRSVFDQAGFFDRDFFVYGTEDDLAIRIYAAGYKIVYEPRCVAYHRRTPGVRSGKFLRIGFRNAAWFNLKHVPLSMFPQTICRNLFWLAAKGIRSRSFNYYLDAVMGYTQGYLRFWIPLRKRHPVNHSVARFCLNDNWISRPILGTLRRIRSDRRYVLDGRGIIR